MSKTNYFERNMKIILACLSLVLVLSFASFTYAEQATGKSAWVINSDKVCGDKLCSEIKEKFTLATLEWSKLNYRIINGTGTAKVIVTDPDMNKIFSYIDTLNVLVSSDSFQDDITLKLYETEKNSGIFERTFTLSENRSAPSILYVKEGDTAIVTYTDKTLPSDNKFSEIVLKETTLIGSSGPPLERVPASNLHIEDIFGNSTSLPRINEQVTISSDIANSQDYEQEFVWIAQIIDAENQVVSLAWINGVLNPESSFSPSISWMPNKVGEFTATMFVWESLDNPSALSPPISIDITISSEINSTKTISESDMSIAEQIFSTCKKDDDCLIKMLQQLPKSNDSEQIFDTIDEIITLYDNSDFYCHPNAHHIGEFLLGYHKEDLSIAIKHADSRCASGILHGLTENTIPIQTLLYGKNVNDVDIVTPCNIVESHLGIGAKVECIHGMGHSIIKAYDYDTVSAVDICDTYPNGNERYMCQGGLFMQNLNKYWDDQGGDFDDNDNYYPCNSIESEKASLCYRYLGVYYLKKINYDETLASEFCYKIENSQHADMCYKGVATHIATRNFDDLESTQKMCMEIEEIHQPICIKGVVESLTRFVSDNLAQEFCESVPESLASGCFKRVDQLLDNRY